jgi:ankyrin repeat protein
MNQKGLSLLHIAARTGNAEIVRLLLEAGCNVNAHSTDRDSSALVDAAMDKHADIVTMLLNAGADPNIRTRDGQSALILAVGEDDLVSAEALLKAGAEPDQEDSLGASARKYAELFHKPAMLALFDKYASK